MGTIPIAKPLIEDREKENVLEVLDSGMIAQGPKVAAFEAAFATFIGCQHAIAVSNGTTALHLALLAGGIEPGDEVITTPFSFISTATSICFTGGKPVFVDIDPRTFNIDPTKIEAAVTDRTKAILPVHLYGQPADMDPILEIAEKYDLVVIEDACQAHGARIGDRTVGGIGNLGCFSFYPTKNMTTGEGGMITTNDDALAEQLRLLRTHGQRSRYEYACLGFNFRMTDIGAAIGLAQLERLPEFNARRRENAALLDEKLDALVTTPYVAPDMHHVYHQYTIRTDQREKLIEAYKQRGVGYGIYYPQALYTTSVLEQYTTEPLPETERACDEVLSLPVHPAVTKADIETIAAATRAALE